MKKELILVVVTIVLLIAAAIAACRQTAAPGPAPGAPVAPAATVSRTEASLTPGIAEAPAVPVTPLPAPATPGPTPAPAIPSAALSILAGGVSPTAAGEATPGLTPGAVAPLPPTPGLPSQAEWQKIAFKLVSEKYKIALNELSVGAFYVDKFPLTNVMVASGIVAWARGGAKTFVVGIDQNGRVFEEDGLSDIRSAELAARIAKYGKLEPRLYDLLRTKGPEDTIVDLMIMVKGSRTEDEIWVDIVGRYPQAHLNPRTPNVPSKDTPKDLFEKVIQPEFDKEREASVRRATAPLIEYLKAKGYDARSGRLVPAVYTALPKKVILELLQREDVAEIVGPSQIRPTMDTASPSIGAPTNWAMKDSAGRPITGEGVFVGILETLGKTVDFADPYLRGTTYGPQDTTSSHPTLVAGAAASNHPKYRGPAYKSTVLSAGFTGNDFEEPASLLRQAGARVINNSWGEWSDLFGQQERYFDRSTRYDRVVYVVGAGNEGPSTVPVRSPGKAYNVITVGSYYDQDDVMWRGDAMSAFSSWANSGDKNNEKPELAAPGQWIYSTTTATDSADANRDWIIDAPTMGTSFAAPQVAGGVAMLYQQNPSLIGKPEAVKAILLASAIHNIEGPAALVSDPGGTNRDGAGGVSPGVAYDIVNSPSWGEDPPAINLQSDFTADGWFTRSSPVISLKKEERLRVATAWDSAAGTQYSWDNFLWTHLDLYLYRLPNEASPVSSSLSTKDSVRVLDFYPAIDDPGAPSPSNYKIKIKKSSSNEAFETTNYLGLAWWKGSRYYATHVLPQEIRDPLNRNSDVFRSVLINEAIEPREPSSTSSAITVPGGIRKYKATLTYPAQTPELHRPIAVQFIEGNGEPGSPFYPTPYQNIDNPNGKSTFDYDLFGAGPQPPIKLARISLRLDGSAKQAYDFYQYFDYMKAATGEEPLGSQTAIYTQFQRGDAQEQLDNNPADDVNITDALMIAQYLAANIELDRINPVNAASPRHDGFYDVITISDALYIQQYLAQIRDEYFELI